MASPFTVFRRNQKVMLAVTGILAMIAFVFIGPTCMQMGGTVGRGDNPPVVSWNYGSIHEGEMFNRMQMRRMLNRFLARSRVARRRAASGELPAIRCIGTRGRKWDGSDAARQGPGNGPQ